MYLLWYDGDKRSPIGERIRQGMTRYLERFGEQPDLCVVNPSEQEAAESAGLPLVIKTAAYVRPNYYWIRREGSGG